MIICDYSTIIGNTPIPLNKVTSWNIKILKSEDNDGRCIYIGVAPFDIDKNEEYNNHKGCGWYFDCYDSTLCSGLPHNYDDKKYGPRKEDDEEYVHEGDSVGVVMDAVNGDLSFALNGINLDVAHEGIPLDKPLVPCVILEKEGDYVELDFSEMKENVDTSIPIPSNVTAKNIASGSITLKWDEVEGAEFYHIELDGSKSWCASTENTFTKIGLFPETEHNFRVRTVKNNTVSEWSDAVKGRTEKAPDFSLCAWEECPGDINYTKEYYVSWGNTRIATKIGYYDGYDYDSDYSTVIGNIPLPPNKVTSWNIKILKSEENDGGNIYIGIAPSDIDQNEEDNHKKCRWYFSCYYSSLFSGPPHSYEFEEYGPKKKGKRVHTGDIVGVVMDTTKGDLSFILDGVNHGVAFEGIPLDKPLVPCVIFYHDGDSVELIF